MTRNELGRIVGGTPRAVERGLEAGCRVVLTDFLLVSAVKLSDPAARVALLELNREALLADPDVHVRRAALDERRDDAPAHVVLGALVLGVAFALLGRLGEGPPAPLDRVSLRGVARGGRPPPPPPAGPNPVISG